MTNKDWRKLKSKIEDFEKRSNGLLRFDEQHPFGVKYLMYGIRDTSKEAT